MNNEKVYKTSEKSARYTKMQASVEEQALYEKWLVIYEERILSVYPGIDLAQAKKLAQENARYLISVFTPATSMGHTLDFKQLKDFWGLNEFKSKKLNMILFHIVFMLIRYNYWQLFKNLEGNEEYSNKSLPVVWNMSKEMST